MLWLAIPARKDNSELQYFSGIFFIKYLSAGCQYVCVQHELEKLTTRRFQSIFCCEPTVNQYFIIQIIHFIFSFLHFFLLHTMKKLFMKFFSAWRDRHSRLPIMSLVVIVSLVLLGWLWIATNVSKTLADGTELNSTNIVTTYGCATDATSCSYHMEEGGISSIAPNTFVNHTLLQYLSLAINNLTSIQSGDFTGLNSLMALSLYGNYIWSIESYDLIELPYLTTLYLILNRIEYIETWFFDAHTGLQMLDLRNNLLTTLPESIMQLTDLTVGDLKLNGNCRNTWLMSAELISFLNEKADSSAWQSSINVNCPVVIDRTAIYGAVDTALAAQWIESNFDEVTNENVTGFENLGLFKWRESIWWEIRFKEALDLTSSAIQDFLENLSWSFDVREDGTYISFTPTGNGSGLNVAANIIFYFAEEPPFMGTGNTADYLIVRDGENNILSGDDLDWVFDGDMECGDGEGGYYCYFDVNHFTSFELYYPPFDCSLVEDVSEVECQALVDLYDATNGDERETNWLQINEVCDWDGIDCDSFWSDIHVTILDLQDFWLEGSIPESFGDLIYLTEIDFSYNYISSIPSTIENLVNLTDLDLYDNDLSSIPENIRNLTGLETLSISRNNLTSISESIWNLTQLIDLNLSWNSILSLPEAIGNLQNLEYLYLQINNLTTLPESFSSLSTGLNLDIRGNCINANAFSPSLYTYLQDIHESLSPDTRLDRWDENFWGDWQWGEYCRYTEIDSNSDEDQSEIETAITIIDRIYTWALLTGNGLVSLHRSEQNRLSFYLGFTINVASGNRDGILYAPTPFTDPVLGERELPDATESNITRAIVSTVQAWASGSSLSTDGGNFTIKIHVWEAYSGETLYIYRSSFGDVWEANTPDTTCEVYYELVESDARYFCEFETDHLSYFTTIEETTSGSDDTPPSGWNGWWGSTAKDTCPDGDTSLSYYDGKCSPVEPTNWTITKTWSLAWSPFIEEINNAYMYAYRIGITSSPTILGADIEGKLIRSHMTKMMVNYAVEVMWLKPDTMKICSFGDVANQTSEIQEYIKLSCQLGLMWIDMIDFDPDAVVTRAQFGTVLSRTLFGDKYNGAVPYYTDHLAALKEAGIMTSIANAEIVNEIRGYVMLMLMRADK